jgi:serine/threonine protein kinase
VARLFWQAWSHDGPAVGEQRDTDLDTAFVVMTDFDLGEPPKCSLCQGRGFLLLPARKLTDDELSLKADELRLYMVMTSRGYPCPCGLPDYSVPRLPGEKAVELLQKVKESQPDAPVDAAIALLPSALYSLTTGMTPFHASSVALLQGKVKNEEPDMGLISDGPEWTRLRHVITRALQKKPGDRYPDAAAMREDLELALKELGSSAHWVPRPPEKAGSTRTPRPCGAPTRPSTRPT